jgi:hypothetical protein
MMGLQETQALFEKPEYKDIAETYKSMKSKGIFDYDEINIFGTGEIQREQRVQSMGQDDAAKLAETVKNIPLTHLIKEFLAKGSTTGIGGAGYLIPVKIYQTLNTYAGIEDVISDVSMAVLPASEIPGSTMDVDIAVGGSYKPHAISSGGKQVEEEIKFTKATLDFGPINTWGINFNIGNDLIEDSQFNMIDLHVRMAGQEMGKYSTTKVLEVMASTTDGDGTLNTKSASEDACTMGEIWDAVQTNLVDEFRSNRILAPSELLKLTFSDTTYSAYAPDFHNASIKLQMVNFFGLDWIRCEHPSLWTETSHLPTDCIGYVFSKEYSYLSGRKRWLRMENYSDPVRDLVGATITARQDTVSIYNDSVCKISE